MRGQILLISGPSGSGKSTLINRLMGEFSGIYFSISSTTRAPRNGEKDGVNYHFISEEQFKDGIENGEFLEWAQVHGGFYGTALTPVQRALEAGKIVIFDIDVQGFFLAQKRYSELMTSVFITTKNRGELKKRLIHRGTDDKGVIENRLFNAAAEMAHIDKYDYFIINDDLDAAYATLKAIFIAMGARANIADTHRLIEAWCEG